MFGGLHLYRVIRTEFCDRRKIPSLEAIMTQEEGAQDESKTSTEQTDPMNGTSSGVPAVEAGRGSDSTSSTPSPSEGRHVEETAGGSNGLKMGSTDSAGNARGPSCSLVSSLLPNSCRGSAEAFARCLHRRLTSLSENGSPERSADAAKPHETTWLHPSSSNHVTINSQHPILQHQPRHSPESDLFFEIEAEEDGPESPAEEATAAELAHLLVNPEILKKTSHHDACHCSPSSARTTVVAIAQQDPESGCVFASPITGTPPDSDSSEVFFDPAESSDMEKPRMEAFFDPISTSDSETTSNLSKNSVPARSRGALSGRRRTDANLERREDTSESSCSSRRNPPSRENGYRRQEDQICSSEDSLNGRSSQETTSLSHESLWSTFDDSTVSLQEESPSRINHDPVIPNVRLPKSHSDSELPCNGIDTAMPNKFDSRIEEKEEVDEVDFVSEVDFVTRDLRNGSLCNANLTKVESLVEDEEESPESERALPKSLSQLKAEDAVSDTDTDPSAYGSAVDIPNAVMSECPNGTMVIETTPTSEMQIDNDNGEALHDRDDEERRLCLLLRKLGGDSAKEEEDLSSEQETHSETMVEEEEDRPQRLRRCSSLKTGKTPPGTPHRKKIVRFADKLGLDLTNVRTFLDEIPRIPNSAYSDLVYDDNFRPQHSGGTEHATVASGNQWWNQDDISRRRSLPAISTRKIDRTLVPLFQQPGGMFNFLDLVRDRRVCLENALVCDPVTLAIQGTVRVINLDFHKSVHVRYTLDAWQNFSDLQATYVPNSCDGFSDKFSFVLYCHTLTVGHRLEFAVRFQCKGVQYWDNNAGVNYCFQCLPPSTLSPSARPYIPITADENRRISWSPLY